MVAVAMDEVQKHAAALSRVVHGMAASGWGEEGHSFWSHLNTCRAVAASLESNGRKGFNSLPDVAKLPKTDAAPLPAVICDAMRRGGIVPDANGVVTLAEIAASAERGLSISDRLSIKAELAGRGRLWG